MSKNGNIFTRILGTDSQRRERALVALSAGARALVISRGEPELLGEMCRVMVEVAGYRLAWIGYAEDDVEKSVTPVAQAGFEDGYLDRIQVSWADTALGMGPVGTSIRERRPSPFQDLQTDPNFAPWRDEAVKRGFASSIGLPLTVEGKVMGSLVVYAAEADAFSRDELGLLEELAENLSFGIQALRERERRIKIERDLVEAREELEERVEDRTRELVAANLELRRQIREREQAQEAMRDSEVRYRTLFDSANDAIFLMDLEGRVRDVNLAACRRLGYTRKQMLELSTKEIDSPEFAARVPERVEELKTRGAASFEAAHLTREGGKIPVEVNARIIDYLGEPAILSIARDITERKEAEKRDRVLRRILELGGRYFSMGPLLDAFAEEIKGALECEAVGIRIRDEQGRIPYGAWQGFTENFVEAENHLCLGEHNCLCTEVIMGQVDPSHPCYTLRGSFFLNDAPTWVNGLSPLRVGQLRGRCLREGYHSLALAPIHSGDEIIGLIQAVDSRRDRFTPDRVELLEAVAVKLANSIERVRAEEAIKLSEFRYRTTIDAMADMIAVVDRDLKVIFINGSLKRELSKAGFDPEVAGKNLFDAVAPLDQEFLESHRADLEAGRTLMREETAHIGGVERVAEVSLIPVLEKSSVNRVVVVIHEITHRKRAEREITWQGEVNRALADLARAVIQAESLDLVSDLVLDRAKQLTQSIFGFVGYIDPRTGCMISTTMTREVWDTCRVADKSVIFEKFSGLWGWVLDHREPLLTNNPEEDLRSTGVPQGHIPIKRFLSVPALVEGELLGQIAMANPARDYTDQDLELLERMATLYAIAARRFRMEDQLRLSGESFQNLIMDCDAAMMVTDEKGLVRFVNPAASIMLGRKAVDLLGGELLLGPDEKSVSMDLIRDDGSPGIAEVGTIKTRWSGEIANLIVLHDITERKQAEKALELSERRFRSVFENVSSGIIATDGDGRVLMANPAALDCLGLGPDAPGRRLDQLVEGARALLAHERLGSQQRAEIVRPDGGRRLLGYTSEVLPLPEGFGLISIFRDLTEIHLAEERRRRSEQLAYVGEMAARLSHEIKNPLAAVRAGLEVIERQAKLEPEDALVVRTVTDEVKNVSRMVSDLLASARKEAFRPKPENLGLLIKTASIPLANVARIKNARLMLQDLAPEAEVVVDQKAFSRFLGNLVLNAMDALPEEGEVMVRWVELKSHEVQRRFPGFDGRVVSIQVRDNGCGIPPEIQKTIFEPFFTTKTTGTGLGLAVARDIVESHGGRLNFTSEPGQGSVFEAFLACGVTIPCNEEPVVSCDGCDNCEIRREGLTYLCWSPRFEQSRLEGTEAPEECVTCPRFLVTNPGYFHRRLE